MSRTKRQDGPSSTGILRLDMTAKSYHKDLLSTQHIEPVSPQPSVDRLSVTFAEDSSKSDRAVMDKKADSEDEDYSASINAIMQRRASTRRSKRRSTRRTSSPFGAGEIENDVGTRRRSSVFTTSSGDTAITMEDSLSTGVSQEQIFENIKLHKEVLSNVKMQPWPMRKKLRLVIQAKNYIKKHEGALQERLAQSHSTKDIIARCNIYLLKKWQQLRREFVNMSNWLIPWERRIKQIESHFGSVVASYFIFLRWLFWVNTVIATVLVAFVALPEVLTADFRPDRKAILPEDKYNATNFLTLWDFEGVFKYSPMFYGWYTNTDTGKGYRLPLAYFFTGLSVYVFSFVATLRKMAENSRMSKLSEKEDECIFSWKLFTGWDYMIGNAETAHNRMASIIMGFKEALLEEAEKKREARSWKVIGSRVLVNFAVLGLLGLSAFAVITVVARSNEKEANSSTWRRNEITIVMSLISLFFPIFFELLGFFEHYHPRKQLRLQLARIMVLNLLNLYSLIIALFGKISDMTKHLQEYKMNSFKSSIETNVLETHCYSLCESSKLIAANLITSFGPENSILNETWQNFTMNQHLPTIQRNQSNDSNIGDFLEDILNSIYNYTDLEAINSTLFSNITVLIANTTELFTNSTDYLLANATDFNSTFYEATEASNASSVADLATPCQVRCTNQNGTTTVEETMFDDYSNRSRLRSLCWETMFGQELVKLTVMDLVMTLLSTLAIDFLRGLFVRYMNKCWCWDLEKRFPQYGDFKVAENILHLVNNQGMVWMGMFFSPGLVVLNVFKLYILMYWRSWAVLTCNVPHEIIFRASRSNNFYFALLLMMLFLCVLPVGYTVVWLEPSWHCGPFSNYNRIFHVFTKTLRNSLPKSFHRILDYIASPGIVIPLLVLLILIIYYLVSLSNALREANNDLKIQLRRERTEERRKMFQIADRRRRGGSDSDTPFGKWKKLLQSMPSATKSIDETPTPNPKQESIDKEIAAKGVLAKFLKRAVLAKRKTEDQHPDQDATDTEQHDSLPDDQIHSKGQQEIKEGLLQKDIIPVITISKTGSSSSIVEKEEKINIDIEKSVEGPPKIKYVLKKEQTEIRKIVKR